jgi:hypothetical protein
MVTMLTALIAFIRILRAFANIYVIIAAICVGLMGIISPEVAAVIVLFAALSRPMLSSAEKLAADSLKNAQYVAFNRKYRFEERFYSTDAEKTA